ncbi:MAG: protein kinase, partial [Myxococcota bacterium]
MTDLFAGRYRLGDVVATDRTGVFHAAEDVRLQRSVTVKLIAPTRSGDTAAVDQFVREARVLGGSSEEGLVQVYDVDVRPPTPYLVTEPLRGQTLDRTLVISSALPFETAYRWITTLAEALCAAHRLGFVHAAVRPSAIFVDGDRVKLLGFGSARATGSRSSGEAEAPADVVPYVAPELLESGTIDPRIDVYALGAVAYRLLAGQPPELGGKREPPSHYTPALPAGVDVFIARALASDPQKRIQSMTQFLAGWEQLGERSLAPELPSAVPIGTLLGGSYEVRGRLGRGSFGTVLLANDSHLDRQVAIKLLHDLDEKVQAKFVAEARAMAAIDHPNVIRVYSLGDHEGVPY